MTEEPFIRQDFSGNADDNVLIQGITGSDSSFGWVGFAYAEANADAVKIVEVDGGDGCTVPTIETIADGSYPVSRDLYIYVNTAKAAENPALSAYVDYYLGDAYEVAVTEAFGDAGLRAPARRPPGRDRLRPGTPADLILPGGCTTRSTRTARGRMTT